MNFIRRYLKYIIISIIILIFMISLSNLTFIKTNGYSVDNVYNTIKELSSDKYKGRRYGTKENMDAVQFVESQFRNIGLKPIGDKGTYLKNYMEPTKVYEGVPVLEVVNSSGTAIKSYKYGEDFTEDGRDYSSTGEITSSIKQVYFLSDKQLEKANGSNLIAVSKLTQTLSQSEQEFYMSLKNDGYKAFIGIARNNANLRKISAGIGIRSLNKSGYEIPNIYVKERVSDELFKYANMGYKIHMRTTTEVKNSPVANVMGMIPGKGDQYLFITSHIDHVGESPDGIIYPGALDNASGVGTMLEIARYIKSQGKKPDKNIVFIAFNAEEAGALGSKLYAENPLFPLYKTTVINLDMIGANMTLPLNLTYWSVNNSFVHTGKEPSLKLIYRLSTIANNLGIKTYEINAAISDHVFFDYYGAAAVTLSDSDTSKIHTPMDNINNIDKKNIDRALKLLMNYISVTAYSNGLISRNSIVLNEITDFLKVQYPLLICIIIAIILSALYYRKYKRNENDSRIRFPILSIIIIMLMAGIVCYFPIDYPYAPDKNINALKLLVEGIKNIGISTVSIPLYVALMVPSLALLMIIKHRMKSYNYIGEGREYTIIFYISIILIVVISVFWYSLDYGKPLYYSSMPDFARSFAGKFILHCVLGAVSFAVWRLFDLEINLHKKNYVSITIFALIFFTLIFNFYKPISYNNNSINSVSAIPVSDSDTASEIGN